MKICASRVSPVSRSMITRSIAGVIDEHMGLAHREREFVLPTSIQLAKTGVAVALRIALDVLVPEKRQRAVLALELAMHARPVRLDLLAATLLAAGIGVHRNLETIDYRPHC
jgi:hypothetical protein